MSDQSETSPEPPEQFEKAGMRLWHSVADEYDLDVHEELLLIEACRVADRLDRLNVWLSREHVIYEDRNQNAVVHPGLNEARQQEQTLMRLIASLRLPSGDEAERPQRRGAARGSYGYRGPKAVS